MKVAIYCRKSVQVEYSESIETQIKMCKDYFRNKECEFEIFEDEGFSGKNTKRPAFQKLFRLVKMGKFDIVAIYKVDRIARNIVDFVNIYDEFDKHNVKLVSITEGFDATTPMGKMMMLILASFAEMERLNIVQRVTDNMLELAKKGCWTGGPAPRGYEIIKIDGKSYLQLTDENFIKDTFKLYLKEQSLYSAHKILKDKYSITPSIRENLRRILRSPLYVQSSPEVSNYLKLNGWNVYGKENGKGYLTYGVTKKNSMAIVTKHEAVIDKDTWLEVQKLLDSKRESYFKKSSRTYWLSSVLKCPICGGDYIIVNGGNKHGYYVCSNRLRRADKQVEKCSNNKYVNAEYAENEIENFLISITSEKQFMKIYDSKATPNNKDDIKIYEKEINENNRMIDNLIDKLVMLSNEAGKALTIRIEKLTQRNIELESNIENEKLKILELNSNPKITFKNISEFHKGLTPDNKRKLIKKICREIIYDPFEDTAKYDFL